MNSQGWESILGLILTKLPFLRLQIYCVTYQTAYPQASCCVKFVLYIPPPPAFIGVKHSVRNQFKSIKSLHDNLYKNLTPEMLAKLSPKNVSTL